MSAFFSMGGHGAFIWPCYIITALLVGGLFWHSQKKLASSTKD